MAQRSASERSAVKLFDNYLHQGVDAESAIELVRVSLGLSRVELEDALRRAGRLNSGQASGYTLRQMAFLVDANGAGVQPDIPHSLWLFLSEMRVFGLHPVHP